MDKKVIHSVFESIVARQPDRIAIETEHTQVSYASLNSYSNRLCRVLQLAGVKPGTIVNVVAPSSAELVGAVLAVFKSGGVYLPVDLSFSEKRLQQVFSNTFEGIVVVTAALQAPLMQLVKQLKIDLQYLVVLEEDLTFSLHRYDGNLQPLQIKEEKNWTDDPALLVNGESSNYIFYTSGSTGEGKAIEGRHAGLSHFIHWEIGEFGLNAQSRISQLTQVTFDASLRDIFSALISGGTLCIPDAETRLNVAKLLQWLSDKQVTLMHCVPSLLRILARELQAGTFYDLSNLQHVLLAGEMLYGKDVHAWRKATNDNIELVNLYGATETTLVKTFYRIGAIPDHPGYIIPVGVPISNTVVAIIRDGALCSAGEIGEVYIKTPFATKGYYRNEELTAAAFVQNPLQSETKDIVYKTGDQGRYLPDGNIEILGRLDNQVKVNGIRVELGEIEQALLNIDQITGAVVKVHRGEDNLQSLVAYYTGVRKDARELRESLFRTVNPQVIPGYFIHLDEWPLNMNGKIDKKALPMPEEVIMGGDRFQAPEGEMEQSLETMWKEILGYKRIGRDISFFSIGGHSLRAIQLAARIHKVMGVELKISDVFVNNTIRDLAGFIAKGQTSSWHSIQPAVVQAMYPLSSAQRRLWALSQIGDGNAAYNMPAAFVLEGALDRDALQHAFDSVIERHEVLRTVFLQDEQGETYQRILPTAEFRFTVNYSDISKQALQADDLRALLTREYAQPFDLANGPLLRASLFKIEANKYFFVYTIHHIVCDGWSVNILIRELLSFYHSYVHDYTLPLTPLKIQYKDYAVWQQDQLSNGAMEQHKNWWLQQFEGELPVLGLTEDRSRPAIKTYNGKMVESRFDAGTTAAFKNILQEAGCTLFMGVLALIDTLLYRYTAQEDIIIGSPIAGRPHAELEEQFGFYVNTLALRSRFNGTEDFNSLLQNVQQLTLSAYEHQAYPFDDLVDALTLSRDMSRSPLFDVLLVMQHAMGTAQDIPVMEGISVHRYEAESTISKYDLVFNISDSAEGLWLGLQYNSDIYDHRTAEQLSRHLEQLMRAIVEQPAKPISQLNYLTEAEETRLLKTFNDTGEFLQNDITVVDLFREQVAATPDHTALIYGNIELSYTALHQRSNQLAYYLREQYHIGPDDLAGILLDRSDWMLVSILAILKAGGAYVAIDTSYPPDRIDYMVSNSKCRLLLDQKELEKFMQVQEQYPVTDLPAVNDSSNLAYVIYTSGTTGNPKGVMIEHRNLVSRIKYFQQHYQLTTADNILFYRSYSFDGAIEEYLLPLLSGAKCCIAGAEFREDLINNIIGFVHHHRITKINMPPALLGELIQTINEDGLQKLQTLRHVVSGGDKLSVKIVNDYCDKFSATLHNSYGPTENTIDSTNWAAVKLLHNSSVPIGRPVPYSQTYILDQSLQLVPEGVPGELFVSGSGLARGYLDQPALTAEKFIDHPFRKGERMYRTGDWARWMPDGNIEFIGRTDEQIKIRGFRVELGEIETALQHCAGVEQAVVVARPGVAGDKELIAFLTGEGTIHIADLRTRLASVLPAYMIPSRFVQVSDLPVTSNGKVDKKQLLQLALKEQVRTEELVLPGNETENILLTIWREILDRQQISIMDNFFDLGGNSIKIIRMVHLVNRRFNIKLTVATAFRCPNIHSLAAYLLEAGEQSLPVESDKAMQESVNVMDETLNLINYERSDN